jgi:hypothetical protein
MRMVQGQTQMIGWGGLYRVLTVAMTNLLIGLVFLIPESNQGY